MLEQELRISAKALMKITTFRQHLQQDLPSAAESRKNCLGCNKKPSERIDALTRKAVNVPLIGSNSTTNLVQGTGRSFLWCYGILLSIYFLLQLENFLFSTRLKILARISSYLNPGSRPGGRQSVILLKINVGN